jgi:hypothetical protein
MAGSIPRPPGGLSGSNQTLPRFGSNVANGDPTMAVALARTMLGRDAYQGWCLKFVARAFGFTGTGRTAAEAAGRAALSGNLFNDKRPPVGAPVYWTGGRGGAGHIAIVSRYDEKGTPYIITTSWSGKIQEVPLYYDVSGLKYVGWGQSVGDKKIKVENLVSPAPSAALPSVSVDGLGGVAELSEDAGREEYAEYIGYGIKFIESVGELKGIFEKAWKEKWNVNRWQGAVRSTKWYRSNPESKRLADILNATDPKTYDQEVKNYINTVARMAASAGVKLTPTGLKTFVVRGIQGGWIKDADEIQAQLAKTGAVTGAGSIGDVSDELRRWARNNGVVRNDGWYASAARQVVAGTKSKNEYMDQLHAEARRLYRGWSADMAKDSTVSLRELASGYFNAAGQLLERDPESLDFNDPVMKKVLSAKDEKGKPDIPTLADFESWVRKDERWDQTRQANQQAAAVAERIGRMLGKVG